MKTCVLLKQFKKPCLWSFEQYLINDFWNRPCNWHPTSRWKMRKQKSMQAIWLIKHWSSQRLVTWAYLTSDEAGKWILCSRQKELGEQLTRLYHGQCFQLPCTCLAPLLIKHSHLQPKEKALAPSPEMYKARTSIRGTLSHPDVTWWSIK